MKEEQQEHVHNVILCTATAYHPAKERLSVKTATMLFQGIITLA